MRVLIIGLFAPDYMIAIANAMAHYCQPSLVLTRQNLAALFPDDPAPITKLRKREILNSTVSLHMIDYTKGGYFKKVNVVKKMLRDVGALQPDIIHYQSGGDPWIPLALLFLRRIPLVVSIHDAVHHPGDKPPKIILTLKNNLLTRLADQVVVHGKQQADILHRDYHTPLKKINTIYLGPCEIYKQLAGQPPNSDQRTILFFGRVSPYKGVESLIRAAPLILDRVPDARFVIAGAGDSSSLERAVIEYPDIFEIHNRFITAEEVSWFFQRASLVVLPYLDATQSGIIPIAYMFRRPVVATRVGSIPEVVDNDQTGLLVEPGDDHALADAVVHLLTNPGIRKSMGERAALKLKRDMSWRSFAEKTMDVYERAIAMKRGRPEVQPISITRK